MVELEQWRLGWRWNIHQPTTCHASDDADTTHDAEPDPDPIGRQYRRYGRIDGGNYGCQRQRLDDQQWRR